MRQQKDVDARPKAGHDALRGRYLFLNFAGRFSWNASTASRWSCVCIVCISALRHIGMIMLDTERRYAFTASFDAARLLHPLEVREFGHRRHVLRQLIAVGYSLCCRGRLLLHPRHIDR